MAKMSYFRVRQSLLGLVTKSVRVVLIVFRHVCHVQECGAHPLVFFHDARVHVVDLRDHACGVVERLPVWCYVSVATSPHRSRESHGFPMSEGCAEEPPNPSIQRNAGKEVDFHLSVPGARRC